MKNIVDILINQKWVFIFGVITAILIKVIMNAKIADAFGFGIMVFLMFSFMTSFIFEGMFGYKS